MSVLLRETGDRLLLETGDGILLDEVFVGPPDTTAVILLAGADVRERVRMEALTIHAATDSAPKTASLTIEGTAPSPNETLRITVNGVLLFNGTLDDVALSYEGLPDQWAWRCTAIGDGAQANRRRPFGTWINVSASDVAADLLADFMPGFTGTNVQAGLPLVSVDLDGSEGIAGALAQLARLIGGYYYFEDQDLHLYQTEASSLPDDLDVTPARFLDDPAITMSSDVSQLQTRVFGKGHGEEVLADVMPGATSMFVANAQAWFNPAGGRAIADTQRLTYTGVQLGPTLIGPWTSLTFAQLSQAWAGIVWVDELGLFVAVNALANTLAAMTSPDGFNWTSRFVSAPLNCGWADLAWSPSLQLLVAVSGSGAVMTSPDGITWTPRTAATSSGWLSVVWAASLNLFVVVAGALNTGTHLVMTSPNGITWTARTAASSSAWLSLTWSPSLSLLVAVASTGAPNAVMTSPDGITWTLRTATGQTGYAVAWSPVLNLFVILAGTQSSTSPDGITWTAHAAALPASNNYRELLWVTGVGFMAFGDGTTNDLVVSTDGLVWTPATAPIHLGSPSRWFVAWSPMRTRFVALGTTSAFVGVAMTNTPTVTASSLTGIPASGPGTVVVPILTGTLVHLWVERDDLAAQADQAVIDAANGMVPADGVYEGPPIVDERRNEASLAALCDATLALYSRPIVTVTYACRDLKTKPGKPVVVNLTSPPMSVTLAIQDVVIDQIDIAVDTLPRFSVTASSVRFSLEDLLRRITGGR